MDVPETIDQNDYWKDWKEMGSMAMGIQRESQRAVPPRQKSSLEREREGTIRGGKLTSESISMATINDEQEQPNNPLKSAGKQAVAFPPRPWMQEQPNNPLKLAGSPSLEYQPAVDLATGRLLGFEALVRWTQTDRTNIQADVLVPWAEASDNMSTLDAWVFVEACTQAQSWSAGIQIAVNCSMDEFREGKASESIQHALKVSGLNPDRLTVEVGEQTISDTKSLEDLRKLCDLGVHLAVDDVGTRWSSLRPFKELNVDTVKIDKSFISGLESEAGMNRCVVEALLNVSHSLAMSTIAEGIETPQQVAILQEFRVDVGQGYFFAHPLSAERAGQLANAETRPVFSLGPGHDASVRHTEDIQPRLVSLAARQDNLTN